jgi:transposase
MKIIRGYKTELDPNNKEATALYQHAGAARFVWNWALDRIQNKISQPNAMKLHKEWNEWKRENAPWYEQVSKCSPQESLRNLERAFGNFFRKCKGKKAGTFKGKVGFPKFKAKHRGIGSFRLTGTIHVNEKSIQLPKLGEIRLKEHEYIPTEGIKILSATVSEHAGRWFVSVQCEQEVADPQIKQKNIVGVDLGIKTLATVSDGTIYENPKALRSRLKKLKRLSKAISRKVKGSSNRKKAARHLAKLHYKISNVRKDTLNKMTTALTKGHSGCTLMLKGETWHCSCGAVIQDFDRFASYNYKNIKVKLSDWRIYNNGDILCQSKTQIEDVNTTDSIVKNVLPMDCANVVSPWNKEQQDVSIVVKTKENTCNCLPKTDGNQDYVSNVLNQQRMDASHVLNANKKAESMDRSCEQQHLKYTEKLVLAVEKKNRRSSALTTSTMMEQNTEGSLQEHYTLGSKNTNIQQDFKHCAGTAIRQNIFSENVHIKPEKCLNTTHLTKTKSCIGIEDLNVSGMMKNHCLAQSIADLGLGEWRRQLEYKGKLYGCGIVLADRFFPSSKLCHICGCIKDDLTLADRTWVCDCGAIHDRDFNASKNLEKLAVSKGESKF